ncbi:MAG TPA: hypothetical protein VHX38_36150 [Pseudonocardiaceae bacterium]|jgi:hypothetical protein|nr:hypothetical protein [Pseudonocardiaceae bacterium]
MYIGVGTVNVSATVEVHGDTAMECQVDDATGGLELTLGTDPSAMVFCTAKGAAKLIDTLLAAGIQGPAQAV